MTVPRWVEKARYYFAEGLLIGLICLGTATGLVVCAWIIYLIVGWLMNYFGG